jgi:hypothetical protein
MSVENNPAYPMSNIPDSYHFGMTYRQWLIGQIAGHIASAVVNVDARVYAAQGRGPGDLPKDSAPIVIAFADALIKRLNSESDLNADNPGKGNP